MLRPAGYPANRTADRWVSDALVTVAAGASAVPGLFHHNPHRPGVAVFAVPALRAGRGGLESGTRKTSVILLAQLPAEA